MHKVGMYGGTFNPLHLGHVSCIIQGSALCEELYVVLCHSNNPNEVPYQERFRWLKQLTKDMENVKVIEVFDDSDDKSSYDWETGRNDILKVIGKDVDLVISGDDYRGIERLERLYPNAYIEYIPRNGIDISSTEIRENPIGRFDYIAKVAQPYYVKKIVVVGTESCGKSTLVRNLAKYYNTTYVEEVGRDICEFAGGIDNMIPSDFEEILYRHKIAELEAIKKANKYLFIDTEALVTQYYLELQFKNTDTIYRGVYYLSQDIAMMNDYDLVIFLEPDVEWVQDGTRTYGNDNIRLENNNLLKEKLKRHDIEFISVSGDYKQRLEKVVDLTNWL